MGQLRVVVAVSRDRSDIYFANQLVRRLGAVGVLVENQRAVRDNTSLVLKALRLVTKPHVLLSRIAEYTTSRWRSTFAEQYQTQHLSHFGEQGATLTVPTSCSVKYTSGVNDINAAENIEWLRAMRPDVVAVCGTSLIRSEFLSIPRLHVLNLHGGLSQHYRGLNTTDWAVHNGEPEYIGATVHRVAPGIDNGEIVYQGRPEISADDTPNSLYAKVVKLGVEMMEKAIRDLDDGVFRSSPLLQHGTLYLGKQFTERTREATWKKYRSGVVASYVADKATRDAKVVPTIINEFRYTETTAHGS